MYKNQLQSYDRMPVEGNPTQSEAWALLQAALKMRDAVSSGEEAEMKAAVRLNLRLWTIFQADLLSPQCQVPAEIRQNMLTLANFIDKRSIDFMSEPIAKNIDVLININREIAGGLHEGARNNPVQEENSGPQEDAEVSSAPPVDLSDLEA
ncbi:MAG: hypothetical protein HWE34_00060 [Methylocystaceae bacterium]|nr:hypothetical protein [Methylocystaceae bacterium]